MSNRVFIGIGSNMEEPIFQVQRAIRALDELHQCTLLACSSLYRSTPVGPQDQPNYINAVACINTKLSPENLLRALKELEARFGRVKTRTWGERIIDLDILLYGADKVDLPHLSIPHKEMLNRDFVVIPLLEIQANAKLPDGTLISTLCSTLSGNNLKIVNSGHQVLKVR